ncbi:hemolysin family protein [Legionella worsleiensis]|uniref:Metal ion transporter n=1 Tax=Legionella worsleiensis TaxID=45076 RepID=A0A0W1A3A9_9GAMM|nr:hemolysin family protein [Legionella worsleiensis]KTD75782.1 metal ion transporter [Legionella worsleiensis]STY32800.1 metal ion transporter [Legionella worsleiensis]
MHNLMLIFLAFLLVLLNAFFVAAEFGMVKLRATKIQTIKIHYGLRGRILAQIHQQLDAYLSACQLGITLASLGLGWIGEPAFAHLLEPVFVYAGITSLQIITFSSFLVAFTLISFLHIVVGELMPKSLAIRQSVIISLWTAIPLYAFYWIMYPVIWTLNSCSNFFLSLLGLDNSSHHEGIYSSDELKLILSGSHLHGDLDKDEREILEHTLDLAELNVTEVMRPVDEMMTLNHDEPFAIIAQKILKNRFSRYPVFDKTQKDMVGVIHVKDVFADLLMQKEINTITPYIRPILKVSHKLPAMDLLRKFKAGMPHFALVYKNKTTLLGFVTLDNLLHVMIGRIKDEFHKTHDDWIKNSDGTITTKGDCSLYSLERALDCDITLTPEEEELNTLYGLIITRHGKLPKEGEVIQFNEFSAWVEKVQDSSIVQIKIVPIAQKTSTDILPKMT